MRGSPKFELTSPEKSSEHVPGKPLPPPSPQPPSPPASPSIETARIAFVENLIIILL